MSHCTTSKTPRQAKASQSRPAAAAENVDIREQLVNGREIGPITLVSLPEAMITSLHGVLFDVDPTSFRKAFTGIGRRINPEQFYREVIKPMLLRHPVLERAEVRISGTGLHMIIRLMEPVVFRTEGERQRWAGIVKAVQRLLPTDHRVPGLNALTRPIGSINSKNGKPVVSLTEGRPVSPTEMISLFEELRARPFATVANVLFATSPIIPCPSCRKAGSSLGVLDHFGHCYSGGCGRVTLAQLFDHFLLPVLPKKEAK